MLNVPPRYKLDTVLNLPKVKFSQTTKLGEYRFVINNLCSSDFGRTSEMEELKEGELIYHSNCRSLIFYSIFSGKYTQFTTETGN